MGVTPKEADELVKSSRIDGYEAESLYNFVEQHSNDDQGLNVFALLIYDLVIFPKTIGYVDYEVVSIVEQLLHKVDPSTTIVAETLRALNYSRYRKESRLKTCLQLLQVWGISHLKYFNCKYWHQDYLEQASKVRWEKKTKKEWIEMLKELTGEKVVWKPIWMPRAKIRFQTARDPWMPLMGLWGVISYLPLLARRQYGSEQFIPVTNGLNIVELDYQEVDDIKKWLDYFAIWKKKNVVGWGEPSEAATLEYEIWHEQRVKDGKQPEMLDPTHPVGNDGRNIVTELAIENRILKDGTKVAELTKRHEHEKKEWKKQKLTMEGEMSWKVKEIS